MKLAEALIERKACMIRIQNLDNRAQQNSIVEEGTKPVEDPEALRSEINDEVSKLYDYILRINHTNNTATIESGETISDAIVKRDLLKMRIGHLNSLIAVSGQINRNRYSRDEAKEVCLLNVADLRKELDELSKQYRELDTLIQAANWGSDLVEVK